MTNLDINKVIKWLGQMLRCPICGIKYKINTAKIIESWSDEAYGEAGILIHSDCGKCKSSVMFNVEIRGPEVYSVGMITDLTGQDSARFKKHKALSTNDVLTIHSEVRNLSGDFISLFASNSNPKI